mgnify:CR=1 FL=1
MKLIINYLSALIIFFNVLLSYTDKELDDMVDYILNGNYIYKNKYVTNENNESFYYKKINNILSVEDDKSKFLKGLIEIDGDLSKQYFVEFYEENPNHKYVDISAIKVADYYYARGVYLKASEWYKKIPEKYGDSQYLERSISYYLNSLLVSGYKDTADYYIGKFKKKFPEVKFSDDYIEYGVEEKQISKKVSSQNNITDKRYSVQIGSFKSYELAKNKKKLLSKEGFLCRIDQILINGETFYAVRTGTFKTKKIAKKEQMRLISRIGIYDSMIIEVD